MKTAATGSIQYFDEVAASRARIEALRLGLAKAEAAMRNTLANAPEHATDCTVTVMGTEFGDGTCNCYVRDCEAAFTEARALLSKPEAAHSPVVPEVGSGETPEVREALGLADKAHERAATAFHPDPFDCALVRLASAIRSRAVTQGSEYDPERVKKLEKALRGVLRDIREGVTSEHRESALERLLS